MSFIGHIKQSKVDGHWKSRHPAYRSWIDMIKRTTDRDRKEWPAYGGRGIRIAEVWQDFTQFADWCSRQGFRKGLQLHRVDNDGPYAPWNCCLLTRAEHHAAHSFMIAGHNPRSGDEIRALQRAEHIRTLAEHKWNTD